MKCPADKRLVVGLLPNMDGLWKAKTFKRYKVLEKLAMAGGVWKESFFSMDRPIVKS